jgi:hypothetical protein
MRKSGISREMRRHAARMAATLARKGLIPMDFFACCENAIA